jgi:hypothetical protein
VKWTVHLTVSHTVFDVEAESIEQAYVQAIQTAPPWWAKWDTSAITAEPSPHFTSVEHDR